MAQRPEQDGDQKTAVNNTAVPSKQDESKADSAQTSEAKDSKKAEKVQLYEVLFPVKINGKRNEIGDKIKLDLSDDALNELVLAKVIKKA